MTNQLILSTPVHGFTVKYSYGGDDYEYTYIKASNGTFSLDLDLVTRGDTVVDQGEFVSTDKELQVVWQGDLTATFDLLSIHTASGFVAVRKLVADLLDAIADERDADIEELTEDAQLTSRHAIRMASPIYTGRV